MKFLQKADDILLKVLKALSVLLMGAMVLLIIIEVLFRSLKISHAWTEELARLATVWCVILSSAAGIRLMEHPYIEVLFKRFPKVVQKVLTILIYAAIAVFGLVLAVYGFQFTKATAMDFMTTLGFHKNYFYAPSCVGGVLYTIYAVREIALTVKSFGKGGADA